jgi:hypothetical protein
MVFSNLKFIEAEPVVFTGRKGLLLPVKIEGLLFVDHRSSLNRIKVSQQETWVTAGCSTVAAAPVAA